MCGLWQKALHSVPGGAQEAKGHQNSPAKRSTQFSILLNLYLLGIFYLI